MLIGMPGCGKTTLGNEISKKLNKNLIDMDMYIEKEEKKSIKEMFAENENIFRDAETKYSKKLSKKNSRIIATGGGIVKRKENISHLKTNSIIVFINRPLENIFNDINTETRPLLADGKKLLEKLYDERINLYKEYCDLEVENIGEISDVANNIIEKVLDYERELDPAKKLV
ncbi:MAG: shikimate kinase [Eubacteriales bacterium]